MTAEQQLMTFIGKQAKSKATQIAKETQSETIRVVANELVDHIDALEQAVQALFAEPQPRRPRVRG